jgi:hypothetical protein
MKPLRAASAAEKGDASTAESTAEKSHALTAVFTADNGHRQPSTHPRLTTVIMLVLSSAGFYDLATAFQSGTIETALTFFGPSFIAALIIAALMLYGALSVPRTLHGSNS